MIIGNNKINLGYVFFGFFLAFFGLLMLANALNFIVFNINLWHLLPILIISIGLSFLDSKSMVSMFAVLCIILITMTAVIASLAVPFINNGSMASNYPLRFLKDVNSVEANIIINASASNINIAGGNTSDVLLLGDAGNDYDKIRATSKIAGGVQDVQIDFNGTEKFLTSELKNNLSVELASGIPVNIYFTSTASNSNIDLTNVDVKKIIINSGASNINLKLGDKLDVSNVYVEAGASSIKIILPETVRAGLNLDSGISSEELSGFTTISKNMYQSNNYSSVNKTVNLDVKMGVGNISIGWYKVDNKFESINLFYYQQAKDKDFSCEKEFILPVSREIPVSDNIIRDAIDLLITGQITEKEKADGFTTEFPKKGFKLINTDLNAGNLTLTFTEVPGFTTGGSCRVMLLAQQIIKTAKQFPGVNQVIFKPDSLFQP